MAKRRRIIPATGRVPLDSTARQRITPVLLSTLILRRSLAMDSAQLKPKTIQEKMGLEEAMRIADIMEADDVISHSAMASRRLVAEIRTLEKQIVELKLKRD
jgi:hypothetical protein